MHNPFAHAPLAAKDYDVHANASAKQQAVDIASGVSREFSNFIADIEDLLKESVSLTGKDLEQAKEMINVRVGEAKKSLDSFSTNVSAQIRKSTALTDQYVHQQPWKAIGAVAALSFLIGLVATRRS